MCFSIIILFFFCLDHITHFFPVKQNYTVILSLIIATRSGSAEFVAVNVRLMYFVLCAFICHNYYDFPADFFFFLFRDVYHTGVYNSYANAARRPFA